MEVHHHPEVEHKGFKEYLLEGLMIFLAVMMGFIAENIRESITEHNRAKEYAETMVSNLAADTVTLNNLTNYLTIASRNVDTLIQLIASNDIKNIPTGKLYWYGLYGGAQLAFTPNDATFEQMRSSGSLRYFEKKIGIEVAQYDWLCRSMQSDVNRDQGVYLEVRKLRSGLFKFQYNMEANDIFQKDIFNKNHKVIYTRVGAFLKSNPPLLSYDQLAFNQYVELVRSRFLDRMLTKAQQLDKSAVKLLIDLKKEYRIDN